MDEYFDRQSLVEWWDQQLLFNATVFVAGAGALGNEVIKNLSLMGVGTIIIADFDMIEASNLSRAVFFRMSDLRTDHQKVKVVAERALKLNPNPNAKIIPIFGDINKEIGRGVFRRIDIALGCLDNREARISLNKFCWQAGKNWIDGGMLALSGSVSVFSSDENEPCYECGLGIAAYREISKRYSCYNEIVKENINNGNEPTLQTTSAIIAAIQVQEAVKILHGLPSFYGKQLIFDGLPHYYLDPELNPSRLIELTKRDDCPTHHFKSFEDLIELEDFASKNATPRLLLSRLSKQTGLKKLILELNSAYVESVTCPSCKTTKQLDQPAYLLSEKDLACNDCVIRCPKCQHEAIGIFDCPECNKAGIWEPDINDFYSLTLEESEEKYLDMSLDKLGIPPLDILKIKDRTGWSQFVELSEDQNIL